MRGAMIRGAPVRAWVGGAGRKTGCRPHGILQPASRFNSKHPASGNRSGGDRGEGVVGASFPDLPDQAGWTVFHLPSALRVVAAVGSATSGRIRAEEVELLRRMGLKGLVAAQLSTWAVAGELNDACGPGNGRRAAAGLPEDKG